MIMGNNKEDSVRIQTSVLNALEKKVLIWLAERQPAWVTSDLLTYIGTFGSVLIAAGYILAGWNIHFLWLSSFGFIVNWYGDSLDGTLARVRKTQRPVYGYYIDHTMDVINELLMFVGIGLSGLMHFSLAVLVLVVYLMLTINVSINAHLKKEFRLTYAGLGPTEFRIIMVIVNSLFALIRPLREFVWNFTMFSHAFELSALDCIAIVILLILSIIYLTTIVKDTKEYAIMDPLKKNK